MRGSLVKKDDIVKALIEIGVRKGDVIIVHSSLRSMGYVDGGAETVIKALIEVLGECGTLAMPTLIQKDFENAYDTWYLDKPSDVGYITEVFRKWPRALRSDQATHSVAAIGKRANELTAGHTSFGPRYGIFGDTAFSHSSPWQKLYDWNAKAIFIGVDMNVNTSKHLLEYMLVEEAIENIDDPEIRAIQKMKIRDYSRLSDKDLIWPFIDAGKYQNMADEYGLLRYAKCGDATFMSCPIGDASNLIYTSIKENPKAWFPDEVVQWFRECGI